METTAGKRGRLARKGGSCDLGSPLPVHTQTQTHLPQPPSVTPVPACCQSSPSTHVHISAQVHTQRTCSFTVSRWALGVPWRSVPGTLPFSLLAFSHSGYLFYSLGLSCHVCYAPWVPQTPAFPKSALSPWCQPQIQSKNLCLILSSLSHFAYSLNYQALSILPPKYLLNSTFFLFPLSL